MSDVQQTPSARERVLRFAEGNHNSVDPWCDPETGHFVDDWQSHLADLMDAYAHELAEGLRAWGEDGEKRRTDWRSSPFRMYEEADTAADLIDPMKHP